jgi:hypothetical protein
MTIERILRFMLAAAAMALAVIAVPAGAQYKQSKPEVTVYASPT